MKLISMFVHIFSSFEKWQASSFRNRQAWLHCNLLSMVQRLSGVCQGQQTVYPSPKYCYLAVHNFFHNLGLVDRVRNFCHTAQFLLNCPLDKRDRPVTANATTVILMEKGADVTPSCQFAAIQLSGVYCKKMRCSIVPEIDRPTHRRSFLHPRTAPVSPASPYGNDSQQQGTGFVLANHYM